MTQQTIRPNGKSITRLSEGAVDGNVAPPTTLAMADVACETRLLLTAVEAAAACRSSVRTWRSWDGAGRIPAAVQLGRIKLWRPLELADWVAAGCPARAEWEWEPRSG
jgi:hypothetical protein